MCKNENTDSGILRGSFICYTWQLNSRAKENLFPLENVLSWVDEVCEKVLFPVPQPTSATIPPFPDDEGYLLDMDSATSPSASRRMTGWEVYCEE